MEKVDNPKENLRTARMANYHKKNTHGLCYGYIITMYYFPHVFLAKILKNFDMILFFKKNNYLCKKYHHMRYSIITINYNDKEGLSRTIKSVINQTSKDFEYIVIDGGSTDGSVDIIKQNADHINYWVSEKDKGVYNAMNKGVAQAHGDYLIFMNSGDCFHSSDILFIVAKYQEDIILGKVYKGKCPIPSGHHRADITLIDLMRGSLPHQAMFIKKELLIKHPYDENYKIVSDWKFCLEAMIIDNCSFRNIDIVIADYDTSGISTNSNGLLPKEKEIIKKEVFPPRIISDYQRFAPVDDELLDMSLLLTQTVKARKAAKIIIKFLLFFTNKNK